MSAAQSAHYLVDKDGKMHPTDVWTLAESSNPTLIDRWEIPTRWRVKYRPCPTFEGMTYWAVLAPGAVMPVARFRTWREAQDYADRMARTREYVLPRPDSTWFEHPVWELGDGVTVYQSIGDQSQTITADYPRIAIPNSKRRELALALLALAEQEGDA